MTCMSLNDLREWLDEIAKLASPETLTDVESVQLVAKTALVERKRESYYRYEPPKYDAKRELTGALKRWEPNKIIAPPNPDDYDPNLLRNPL
jgi:hypothetical protein